MTSISAVLLLALVAFLFWDASRPKESPSFEAIVGAAERRGEHIHVPVEVCNTGGAAARTVEVRVSAEGEPAIEGQFTIDWIPGRSSGRGVAILSLDAAGKPVRARVLGYAVP